MNLMSLHKRFASNILTNAIKGKGNISFKKIQL